MCMTSAEESPRNTMETEVLQLPNELVYEPVMQRVNRHSTANHLASYVLWQLKRSIPEVVRRPPVGYLEPTCSMPVEIFYEILEHLHPIDLYHISQANRAFQTLLSDPNSSSVWTLAFENDPAFPKCPPVTAEFPTKMTGLEWVALLFGKHICQLCGDGGAPPNIPLRHFRCSDCAVSLADSVHWIDRESAAYTLVKKSQVLQLSPDQDSLNPIDRWYMYNVLELDAVHEAITEYEDAIMREESGAREAFDTYKAKRKTEVDPVNEHSAICLRWAEELQKCYGNDSKRRNSNIMKRIRSRSRREGHQPEDVEKATDEITIFNNASRLSNKRWEMIKPLLEPAITRAKNERLARERGVLINRRKELVHELYREYKKALPPLTWAYPPPHYVVFQFKRFAELIKAPHDNELNRKDCEDALHYLPKEIECWTVAKKKQLVSLLPERGNGGTTTSHSHPDAGLSSGTSVLSQEPGASFDTLQLATSVFCCVGSGISPCKTGLCLIGWEAAGPHLRCSALETYGEKRLRFNYRGRETATALVNLAGLDPRTATTMDMDRLDYRYICTWCPIVTFRDFKGRRAYNWRDAVLHYTKKTDHTYPVHPTPRWILLTAKDETDVKHREEPDPYATDSSWSCTLCPEHFKNLVPREEAIQHVNSRHNVETPVESTHFFYLVTRDDRTPRQQVGFPQSHSSYAHYISRVGHVIHHLRRSLLPPS